MKETIYTIPLSDAMKEPSECPFCVLEKQLERKAVEYSLGASMMEPDSRLISNEKGFCRRHFAQMFDIPNALSLALVLDTHMNEVIEKLEKTNENSDHTKSLFRKKSLASEETMKELDKLEHSCAICDKINHTMKNFSEIFWYLYRTETDFKEKVLSSQGFCLPHFQLLLSSVEKEFSGEKQSKAVSEITDLEIQNLKRIKEDIHWFTKKFDYRYVDEPWKTSKDAPIRTIEKLAKFIK